MDRDKILNRYKENEEDRLIASKILDRINLSKTKNRIESSDFLSMHGKNIALYILNSLKETNYKFFGEDKNLDKQMLILYPENKAEIFENNRYDYSSLISIIRIELPDELKGTYEYRDYLSGIMKLGIERETFGDILVYNDRADVIVEKEVVKFLLLELPNLIRFKRCKIEEININELEEKIEEKEEINIISTSLRLDNIVAELARCSRSKAKEIIETDRVTINYENENRLTRQIKENDIIVIRGKGKFIFKEVIGETKSNKLRLVIEHYI